MATEYTAQVSDGAWAQDNGYNPGVDQNGSSYQNSHDQQEAHLPDAQASFSRGDFSASGDNATETGAYDPSSLAPPRSTSQSQIQPSSKPPNKQRSAGGFLVEDSDSEDETATPASQGTARGAAARAAPSALRNNHAAQAAGSVPSVVSPSSQVNTVVPTPTDVVPSATGLATAGAGRARLPNDTVGILEDKIREDPRGAMDSWLALMAEHRKRNKTNDARKVYERFLELFPTSVCALRVTSCFEMMTIS
jgi:cleavage stimulation factor subunit 3